jgi:hypothetical protein
MRRGETLGVNGDDYHLVSAPKEESFASNEDCDRDRSRTR